jgi:uncharacterized protein (DUF486 family)
MRRSTYGHAFRGSAGSCVVHADIPLDAIRYRGHRGSSAIFAPNPGIPAATRKDAPSKMRTILLLTISNIFMTFAWYGHLKYRSEALWNVILASWGIAFFEYCFQVPANRIGSYEFSAAQLKTIQELITLVVFSIFSVTYSGR